MSALLTFDVFRSRFPSSELGEQLEPITARDYRAAKAIAAERHGPHVVVIPRPKTPPLDAKSRAFLRSQSSHTRTGP
jgi:hypothetical protein